MLSKRREGRSGVLSGEGTGHEGPLAGLEAEVKFMKKKSLFHTSSMRMGAVSRG
jgi:hypothetical protein